MTMPTGGTGTPRAFAVLPEGQPDPAGLRVIGRVDRFDLGAPIAARIGADVLVLSERLVDAEDGWDAVRGIATSTGTSVWILADGQGRNRDRWRDVATRVLSAGAWVAPDSSGITGGSPRNHDLVLVLGTKGGVGKTFLSANLVYAAAAAGLSITAVDLDAETGDLGLRLGIEPGIDLAGVKAGSFQVTPQGWATSKRGLPVRLLAAIPRPEFASILDESLTRLLLDDAAANSQCTVVDTPSDPDNPALYAAMDRASSIVLTSTLNPGSVRQAKTMVDLLKRLNIPVRDRLLLVVNRYSRRATVDASAFRDLVGHEPRVILGDIGLAADLEAYFGCPTMGSRNRKRIAEPILTLARAVFHEWPSSPRVGKHSGLLGRLGRRKHQPGYLFDQSPGWM